MKLSRLLLTVTVLLLLSLGGGISSPAANQQKMASMKGKVFFSDVNQPIPNALVALLGPDGRSQLSTSTDDQGNYDFPIVAGGVYTISIQAPFNRSEGSRCRLNLQNLRALSVSSTRNTFVAVMKGFSIKSGAVIAQDFDFACQKSSFQNDFERQVLQPGLRMLEQKRVPFDPNQLRDDEWRAKLETPLAQMPELQKDLRVTSPMSGVYLAGTILLPEQVELKGDTFMLVREFAPIDENSTISIEGPYRLYIFVIGDKKQYQAMSRRWGTEYLKVDVAGPCGVSGIAPVFRERSFRCGRLWSEDVGSERK